MSSLVDHAPVRAPSHVVPPGKSALLAILIIVAAVVLERLPTIAFAYLNVDESAYLAIGEALLRGALPYVDIIDRKPVGLYLIYAAAVALFRDPIIGARVLGLIATSLSAWLIVRMARRFARTSWPTATLAAVFFSCYAILYGGDAAQYNVFVMPFVAAAAVLVLAADEHLRHGAAPSPLMLGTAGLLLGLAMQIKYTAGFESVGFGCWLIAVGWRQRGLLGSRGLRRLGGGLGLMIVGGVLPTAVAAAAYWRVGHIDAFVFYNFTVNFIRPPTDYTTSLLLGRIGMSLAVAMPLAILSVRYAALQRRSAPQGRQGATDAVLVVWMLSGLFGALVQRQPYLHYFYAVVPPLAIWAAQALGNGGFNLRAQVCACAFLILPLAEYAAGWAYEIRDHGSANLPRTIAQDLRHEDVRSLYVFNYFGVLYHLSGLPSPTRYTLPTHLLRDLEAASFQFDARAELGRILAEHPEVIVVTRPYAANIAPDRIELLNVALEADYCVWRTYVAGQDTVYLYRFRGRDANAACK